jgi:hypothetical protein
MWTEKKKKILVRVLLCNTEGTDPCTFFSSNGTMGRVICQNFCDCLAQYLYLKKYTSGYFSLFGNFGMASNLIELDDPSVSCAIDALSIVW